MGYTRLYMIRNTKKGELNIYALNEKIITKWNKYLHKKWKTMQTLMKSTCCSYGVMELTDIIVWVLSEKETWHWT